MALFRITSANSVTTTGATEDAFSGGSAGPDTLIVEEGAFLKTEGSASFGAFLDNTGAWTVQVNGLIQSAKSIGVDLEFGNTGASTIAVATSGEIDGKTTGIYTSSALSIANAGLISSGDTAIHDGGSGPLTVRNSGRIEGATHAILGGFGGDTVTSSGIIKGAILLREGNDRLTNSDKIINVVDMGDDDDTVVNARTGILYEDVRLGRGHDMFTNAGIIAGVADCGDGNDVITNSGNLLSNVTLGSGLNTLINSGLIGGGVSGGADKDVVKNSGAIQGTVDLGGGDDSFTGGNTGEIVVDGAASDTIKLGGGDDFYFGIGNFNQAQDGTDIVDGGAGFDAYLATSATDSVFINLDSKPHDFSPFLPGQGLVAGNTATGVGLAIDTIRNFEAVTGGSGNDIIYGNGADNVLVGGSGFDTLYGFGGNDVLIGGNDGDALYGGLGTDDLTGGQGVDYFQFAAIAESKVAPSGRDVISDFESGIDRIDLHAIDANTKNGKSDDAFTFIGDMAFSKVAGQLRAYSTAGAQIVEGDVNGDGKADFSIEVVTTAATLQLTAADFLL